ncbi:MAG: DUF45 domain-containing protein [Atopobiaceae bacterium]|nr:DUF45 domain-containing protein [Atopobiaceae bacterium]
MAFGQIESITLDGCACRIYRSAGVEPYFSLIPPQAKPSIVAPPTMSDDELLTFAEARMTLMRAIRKEAVERYNEAGRRRLRCHYRTGDSAYVLGRPYVIRVISTSSPELHQSRQLPQRDATTLHQRTQSGASLRHDLSLVTLYVDNPSSLEERREVFLNWARPLFVAGISPYIKQSARRAQLIGKVPSLVDARSTRRGLVRFDDRRNTIWFSDELIAFPPICSSYAFMLEVARNSIVDEEEGVRARERTQALRDELVAQGCPGWMRAKLILDNADSPYRRQ